MAKIAIRRVYEPAAPEDGFRVLVDRLWPRGLRKEDVAVDRWAKEVAPSTELRRWVHADASRWETFCGRYREELAARPEALAALRDEAAGRRVTLLVAARDPARNHAVVLRQVLEETG